MESIIYISLFNKDHEIAGHYLKYLGFELVTTCRDSIGMDIAAVYKHSCKQDEKIITSKLKILFGKSIIA